MAEVFRFANYCTLPRYMENMGYTMFIYYVIPCFMDELFRLVLQFAQNACCSGHRICRVEMKMVGQTLATSCREAAVKCGLESEAVWRLVQPASFTGYANEFLYRYVTYILHGDSFHGCDKLQQAFYILLL